MCVCPSHETVISTSRRHTSTPSLGSFRPTDILGVPGKWVGAPGVGSGLLIINDSHDGQDGEFTSCQASKILFFAKKNAELQKAPIINIYSGVYIYDTSIILLSRWVYTYTRWAPSPTCYVLIYGCDPIYLYTAHHIDLKCSFITIPTPPSNSQQFTS